MFERQQSIRALTACLADTEPSQPMSFRLSAAATTMLHHDGACITLGGSSSVRTVLSSTTQTAAELVDLQVTLGEGPSLETEQTEAVVQSSSADLEARWPLLAREALARVGHRPFLLSIPIRPELRLLGVLTMHATDEPRPAADLEEAQFLADAIGYAVLHDWFERAETTRTWARRDQVNQAIGMVVAQLRVTPDDATAVLRAHAFANGATLEAVAASVVRRELDFTTSGTDRWSHPEDDHE